MLVVNHDDYRLSNVPNAYIVSTVVKLFAEKFKIKDDFIGGEHGGDYYFVPVRKKVW